jgi:hypothetical protein
MNPESKIICASKHSGWFALAIYLALSTLFFGHGLIGHFSDRLIGIGPDPANFIFFLAWWPYAALNHLNPFITHSIWTPHGFNLAWTTFVPLAGILASPITLGAGPVAAYNISMLLCPAFSAWTAFLLCRLICGRFWPALAGGYVYGFSAFMLTHMSGQLDLTMAFFPPLAVFLALRRINGLISAPRLAILLALVLIGQIGSFLEVLATMTLFGGVALALGWSFADQSARAHITALAAPIAAAYLLAALVASPYLYCFFAGSMPSLPSGMASLASANTYNMLIPSPFYFFGSSRITEAFCGGVNEYGASAYLGPVAMIVVYGYARSQWHLPRTRLLIALFLIAAIASLGPSVFVAGAGHVPMPWRLIARLPLFDKAEPARVSLFTFLVLAVIVTLWLEDRSRQPRNALIGAAALILFFLPNPSAAFWTRPLSAPPFFAKGLYRKYIAPGATVLILPYGVEGDSDIWLAMSGMYFRMAGGYVGVLPAVPPEYEHYLAVKEFYTLAAIPDSDLAVKTFLAQKNVNTVIIADEGNRQWLTAMDGRLQSSMLTPFSAKEKAAVHSMFATLGAEPIRVGGVLLYPVPLDKLAAYRNSGPPQPAR